MKLALLGLSAIGAASASEAMSRDDAAAFVREQHPELARYFDEIADSHAPHGGEIDLSSHFYADLHNARMLDDNTTAIPTPAPTPAPTQPECDITYDSGDNNYAAISGFVGAGTFAGSINDDDTDVTYPAGDGDNLAAFHLVDGMADFTCNTDDLDDLLTVLDCLEEDYLASMNWFCDEIFAVDSEHACAEAIDALGDDVYANTICQLSCGHCDGGTEAPTNAPTDAPTARPATDVPTPAPTEYVPPVVAGESTAITQAIVSTSVALTGLAQDDLVADEDALEAIASALIDAVGEDAGIDSCTIVAVCDSGCEEDDDDTCCEVTDVCVGCDDDADSRRALFRSSPRQLSDDAVELRVEFATVVSADDDDTTNQDLANDFEDAIDVAVQGDTFADDFTAAIAAADVDTLDTATFDADASFTDYETTTETEVEALDESKGKGELGVSLTIPLVFGLLGIAVAAWAHNHDKKNPHNVPRMSVGGSTSYAMPAQEAPVGAGAAPSLGQARPTSSELVATGGGASL